MSKRKSKKARDFSGKTWGQDNSGANILHEGKIKSRRVQKRTNQKLAQFERMLQKFLKSDNAISHSEIDEARMIYLKINSFKRRKALRKDLNIYLKNCKKQSLRPSIVEYFKKESNLDQI